MTNKAKNPANTIDSVFADTWLTVCQLKNGVPIDNGLAFYQRVCEQIDTARQQLQELGYSTTAIEHMLYAQCALLDESVMNRNIQDAGYEQWLKSPLQATYFNTLEAGAKLWDRIANVLHETNAEKAVLICFHRVLALGFTGQYRSSEDQHRTQVLKQLTQRVPAYALSANLPLTKTPSLSFNRRHWYWLSWVLGGAALFALWWYLSNSLQQQLQQLLH